MSVAAAGPATAGPATAWGAQWLARPMPVRERALWRGVEAQHLVATIKLTDTLAEQAVLEELIETSKPPLPAALRGLHYLLATPFRYRSPHGSRFRAGSEPGLWYGAETLATACCEVGYWRWRFVCDSDGLRDAGVVSEHTFFQARVAGRVLDLTTAPWRSRRTFWTDASDYGACQALTGPARAAGCQWIRYESVRAAPGRCGAVIDPASLSLRTPWPQQTWVCKAGVDGVQMLHEHERLSWRFASTDEADPADAGGKKR